MILGLPILDDDGNIVGVFCDAKLSGEYRSRANLSRADLRDASLPGADDLTAIDGNGPGIAGIPARIAGAILAPSANHMFYGSKEHAMQWLKDREYAK